MTTSEKASFDIVKLDPLVSENQPGNLSKKKAKKLAKIERRNQFKMERRHKERDRKKERRRVIRENEGPESLISRKRLKANTMETSSCRLRVAVDCSYDNLMSLKDIKDLGGQLARCYSINRRLENPIQYYIITANGSKSSKTTERLKTLNGIGHWDVHFKSNEESQVVPLDQQTAVLSCFDREEVVYLTSESPNVLDQLDETKVYIVGGLVDHNTQKGLTFKLANEMGITHAQLPIGQYVKMLYRKVLTVCHVFEILTKYSECKDWQKAFIDTIPKRHNVEPIMTATASTIKSEN